MKLIIFIEILFAPAKFKLDSDDIIISSAYITFLSVLLALYLNYLLKKSNAILLQRYEKSNTDFVQSVSSVLSGHTSFSGQFLKNYTGLTSVYTDSIFSAVKNTFSSSGLYRNEFIQHQNLFYIPNKFSLVSLMLLRDNYIPEAANAAISFKYYALEASLMSEKTVRVINITGKTAEVSSNLKSTYRMEEIALLNAKHEIMIKCIINFSNLAKEAYSNYTTLGDLKTDDLRYEAELIMQQLFDTYHNYGNTIYSLLNRYFDQLNLSLNEFTGRSIEYINRLSYSRLVSEIRKTKNIDVNIQIVPINVKQEYRDIVGMKSADSNAGFYILQQKNIFTLYPINAKNNDLYLAFDIDTSDGSGKAEMLEPALCSKISNDEFKIIKKGIIKLS